MIEIQLQEKVGQSIQNFFACQGITRSDQVARINATLLKRAWELAKIEGEEYSTYSLIADWNAATDGAAFTDEAIEIYLSKMKAPQRGSQRQAIVAKAVQTIIADMPPSCNKSGGDLNSILINLAWKTIDALESQTVDALVAELRPRMIRVMENKEKIRYKTPSGYKIAGQSEVGAAAKDAIRKLKEAGIPPLENGRVNTKLAGLINAVAWKLRAARRCTAENIFEYIRGKTIPELQLALRAEW